MALCTSVNRSFPVLKLGTVAVHILQKQHNYVKYQSFEEPEGPENKESALDDFTDRLMQRKVHQWENNKKKLLAQSKNKTNIVLKPKQSIFYSKEHSNIENLTINRINSLLQEAIRFNDNEKLMDITRQCIKYNKCPSLSQLSPALAICSQNGDKDTIVQIVQLCENTRPEILEGNSNFEHYLAEAIWVRGNIVKSLEMFEKLYRENNFLRIKIRCILKNLIPTIITNQSQASIVKIIKFSEHLVEIYDDYFLLQCIWQACFLSEWFADQQMAFEILENHPNLWKEISNKMYYIVNVSLNNHQTEVIYRLTELLLKYDMKEELPGVVLALFNYFIKLRDHRRCRELAKWSISNEIKLPNLLKNQKFLQLTQSVNDNVMKTIKDLIPEQHSTKYKF
ncbi:uncharacterized protein LOC115885345 [Sitophilus oryzae]|uniref:Uncharacterized protein LOC115885345 n=1 Tax=Sitophilus oryzae TaxID=7048 RepID=A0A6J2YA22_SITOR|nr:uncharacterized protein LOC115885345 [Sitophilus oryzae]XP_030760086.1 uncharacterized protein LOC115885345 [Sitophilus oryzae]XP_030760087.1 uncharacterized protein LOC115885345 [Sitophilus oryzae]